MAVANLGHESSCGRVIGELTQVIIVEIPYPYGKAEIARLLLQASKLLILSTGSAAGRCVPN